MKPMSIDPSPARVADAAAVNTPPVAQAFDYARDRLDRLEHILGNLNGDIMRLGDKVGPACSNGRYQEPDEFGKEDLDPTPEDRRSPLAREIDALGQRADKLADATALIRYRVEAITDAIEL